MKTSDFIELLDSNPGLDLSFEYQNGKYIRGDYHITEIKNVSFDTVDCGGVQNKWEETHVQLWENAISDSDNVIDTTKALKIFQVVQKVRPTFQDTEIKFEYGVASAPMSVMSVMDAVKKDSRLIVQLASDQATCKAKDRASTPEEAAGACCGTPEKEYIPLGEGAVNGCTPGGGCC